MEKMGRVICVLYLLDFDLGVQTDYYRCITKHPLAVPDLKELFFVVLFFGGFFLATILYIWLIQQR